MQLYLLSCLSTFLNICYLKVQKIGDTKIKKVNNKKYYSLYPFLFLFKVVFAINEKDDIILMEEKEYEKIS